MVLLPHKYWWGKFARGHPETLLVDADCTWNGHVYGTLYHLSQDTSIKNGANHSETAKLDIYSQWTHFLGWKLHIFFWPGNWFHDMGLGPFEMVRGDSPQRLPIQAPGSVSQTTGRHWDSQAWRSFFHVLFMGNMGNSSIDICNIWLNQWPFQEPKLEVPNIYKAYVREYPYKIWPYMVQYLHFRILEISHWLNIFKCGIFDCHIRSLEGEMEDLPTFRIVWEAVVHAFAASRQTGQKSPWFITDYLSSLLV